MNKKLKTYINTIILLIISLFSLLPFYYMIIMGTYRENELFNGVKLLPGTHLLENLKEIFSGMFLRYYWNSLYTSFLAATISIIISALAGYALSKFDFKLKKSITTIILATMMVPTQLGLIAYVIEMKFLHLTNTLFPLVALFAAMPFGVFFMISNIKEAVPTEVLESARIDGCSEPAILVKIVVGFIKPALGSLFLLVFIWTWNNYLLPVVVLNNPKLFTIPLGIMTLGAAYSKEYALRILGLALGTLPLILFFLIFSKNFIQGLASGAVKG